MLTIGIINLPPVQNYIVDKLTTYLTEGTGYETTVDYANIRWFNSISLDGTTILDKKDSIMIDVRELVLDFDLISLIKSKDIKVKEAWVNEATVNLRNADSVRLNIDRWALNIGKLTASTDTTQTAASGFFGIDKISLLNSTFSISNDQMDSIVEGFDYNHFRLKNINADLLNLKAIRDTFQIDVKFLSATDEKTGLTVDELRTFFRISQKGMAFHDLYLQMGKTIIKESVIFKHERPSQMAYFVDSVDIYANFEESIIHTDELGLFAHALKDHKQSIQLSGYFEGRVNYFYSSDFLLTFGNHTKLQGEIDLEGLPDINQTIFSLNFRNSTIKATDFQEYLNKKTFGITDKLGLVKMNGRFDGFANNFVANGDFETDIGNFSSNTQLEIPGSQQAYYRGALSMQEFDLGYFTGDSIFQKVDMQGSIEGSGFTLEEADFKLDADIYQIGINDYNYVNIITNGQFAQSFFSGRVDVNDPNFALSANGSIDLREKKNLFNISGKVTRSHLKPMNITNDEVSFTSNFQLDISGLKLDNIQGGIALQSSYIKYKDESLLIDSLYFSSQKNNGNRKVNLNSNHFNVALDGNFDFTNILEEVKSINKQYGLIFSSKTDEVEGFLKNRETELPFNINFQAKLLDISPIIQLFDTAVYISPNASVIGRFTNNEQEDLTINAKADTIRYGKVNLINNELDINANSLRDDIKVLTLGYFYSEKQSYANTSETESLTLEAVWDGKHIDVRQNIGQESSGNYAEIGAGINFLDDRIELRFEESNLLALDEVWKISKDNIVRFEKGQVDIKHLRIFNQTQSISLDGEVSISKDSTKTLAIELQEVNIENINPVTHKKYAGKINGNIKAQNLYFDPLIYGSFQINSFAIDQFPVGDILGSMNWSNDKQKFDMDFEVNRDNKKIITLDGDFYPTRRADQLNLQLTLNDAKLDITEPYIEDYFTQVDGLVNGSLSITGSLQNPSINGNGRIDSATIKVNYLNTKYLFDGNFNFDKNSINLSKIQLYDLNANTANFTGSVKHHAFKNFTLDLSGELENFQVLNTTPDNEDLYYGDAYVSGIVDFQGNTNNLNILANVITQPNTRIFIPVSQANELAEADYIKFINRTDTATHASIGESEVEKIKIEGLKLDLDIGITPDAYTEIIIDPKTGDIIRGRGNGQLRLQIDTQGDFNMTGDFDITEGAYNFSLYNIITKEFQMEQPSRISWYGDPYKGIMDIKASYAQNTSLAPLLNGTETSSTAEGNGSSSTNNRRFPTKVLLKLDGELLSPEIVFDIDFSQINTQDARVQTAVNAFKNKIANDEQELNRQVLSLIVLNSFSEAGAFNISGQSATQNVSQLLSNQLSQLVAQLDENLEVDFDLAGLNNDAFNTFQLRLSYTFLDGRLRITREGGLSNLVNVNSIAGDWTAEYLLTPDGRYKVKVYSRNNYDLATAAITENSTTNTTGASLTQTISFNNLKEFFAGVGRNRKKRKSKPVNQ